MVSQGLFSLKGQGVCNKQKMSVMDEISTKASKKLRAEVEAQENIDLERKITGEEAMLKHNVLTFTPNYLVSLKKKKLGFKIFYHSK